MTLVPIREEDKAKPYYKYYEQGIPSPTEEQLQMVAASGHEKGLISVHERHKLIEGGSFPAEIGFYPLEEGGLLCAANIPMPDVNAKMLYWWFAWHGLDPFRYAIWDPEDHFDVQINEEGRNRSLDPAVPMEEKTWGATHTVQESIGGPPQEIIIHFTDPKKNGFDPSFIGTKDCEFLITANGLLGGKVAAIMDEGMKEIDGVKTFMARFWIGYNYIDGKAKCLVPVTQILPEEEWTMIANGLIAHSLKEFSNLNTILPSLYQEQKGTW